MSRSIHENWSWRWRVKKGSLDSETLRKKSRIKSHKKEPPIQSDEIPTSLENIVQIDITIKDEPLFSPLSAEEITQVLTYLPPGSCNGITCVRLKNGKKYVNDHTDEFDMLDPYTATKCYELFPGIYIPMLRGMYDMQTNIIELYAYIISPTVSPTRDQLMALKFQMLKTLFHEIAHHQDRTTRIARGRWMMDNEDKAESFAEKVEAAWCKEIILPFLQTIEG